MKERSWFHCPLCPDDVWKPLDERVPLKKPIKINGYIVYGICRDHAIGLARTVRQRRQPE